MNSVREKVEHLLANYADLKKLEYLCEEESFPLGDRKTMRVTDGNANVVELRLTRSASESVVNKSVMLKVNADVQDDGNLSIRKRNLFQRLIKFMDAGARFRVDVQKSSVLTSIILEGLKTSLKSPQQLSINLSNRKLTMDIRSYYEDDLPGIIEFVMLALSRSS